MILTFQNFNSLLLNDLLFLKEVYLYRNDEPTLVDIIKDNIFN